MAYFQCDDVVDVLQQANGLYRLICRVPILEVDSDTILQSAVNSEMILYVYSWGVGSVLLLWSIGYAVGAAIKVIRMA